MSTVDLTRLSSPTPIETPSAMPSRRDAAMPWRRNRRPLSEDDIAATWPRLLADCGSPRQRLAYIHVPFCANHCLFCAFYRNAYTATEATTYAARIRRDRARG